MGKKDLTGKDYFADRGRFADLMNAFFYQGKKIIQAGELEKEVKFYPAFHGKGEMGRDVFMKDTARNICYGLELETESDYSMPERIMVYDACELESQIREKARSREKEQEKGKERQSYREKKSRMKEMDFLVPILTMVLYLGTGHWEGKRKLSELYRISEETEGTVSSLLPDYGFPLLEADYMNAEVFETDLKEFFQAMQCRNDKKKLKELLRTERFRHLKEETAWAIAVHLDRKRLAAKIEKEKLDMCIALDELLADERAEGRVEGRTEGEKKGKKEERVFIIRNMLKEGMDQEFICRVTGCSPQEFASVAEG